VLHLAGEMKEPAVDDVSAKASVAVYLNDSSERDRGFRAGDAALRIAARFTIPAPLDQRQTHAALEGIYVQLNVGGDLYPAADYTLRYRGAGHRSLSIGDVVVIGESAFAVSRCGFDPITAVDLTAATRRATAS